MRTKTRMKKYGLRMIESNTQTVIEINDKRNLAQVQPGVRVVGSPYPARSLRPWGLKASNAYVT